jgi:glutathione S-transferase
MTDELRSNDAPEASARRDFLKVSAGVAGLGAMLAAGAAGTAQAAPSSANLVLYHIEGTRSERVVWLMTELGLPFKFAVDPHDGKASYMAMKGASVMGMSPTIHDDGKTMVESGAILEYIINKYGNGRLAVAPTHEDYQQYLMWMHYAEGSAAARMQSDYWAHEVPDVKTVAPVLSSQMGGAQRVLGFTELTLAQQPYFGGQHFTAADIMMHFPMKLARMWAVDLTLFPHTYAWMQTVEARPNFQKAMALGNPNGGKPAPGRFQPLLSYAGKGAA